MDTLSALHPLKFNSSPLEDDPPFLLGETVTFQGRTVKLQGGYLFQPGAGFLSINSISDITN